MLESLITSTEIYYMETKYQFFFILLLKSYVRAPLTPGKNNGRMALTVYCASKRLINTSKLIKPVSIGSLFIIELFNIMPDFGCDLVHIIFCIHHVMFSGPIIIKVMSMDKQSFRYLNTYSILKSTSCDNKCFLVYSTQINIYIAQ